MNIKIVYFAYLVPDKWETIVDEQLSSLHNLELYNIAKNIYFSVIGDDIEFEKLQIFLSKRYPKVEIKNRFTENYYEYPGLKTIYQIAEDDDNTVLLYFHSKGMTSNQHETRKTLFKYTIENYQTYLDKFSDDQTIDVAGAIPHINGFIFFNFFWVRSSYIRNYCNRPEISDNRYIWEVWVGTEFSRKKKVITYSPLIKSNQVTHHHEVWAMHDKMINNFYDTKQIKLETMNHVPKPIRIDRNTVNLVSKPVRIDTNTVNQVPKSIKLVSETFNPITVPDKIYTVTKPGSVNTVSKPVRIEPGAVNTVSKPVRIEPGAVNTVSKPVRIEPGTVNTVSKPVRIEPGAVNTVSKPVRIEPSTVSKPDSIVAKPEKIELKTVNPDSKPVKLDTVSKPVRIDSINGKPEKKESSTDSKPVKLDTNSNIELYKIDNLNPYTVFERLRNKSVVAIDLGAGIGHHTYMLSKRFKKVIAVENNINNLKTLELNNKNYCYRNVIICNKNIVSIKTNLETDMTLKELLFENIHKHSLKPGIINCDLSGKEEDILEDLFHYAFHSKVKVFIKLNVNNWKNKDLSRFNYLFDFFNHNQLTDEWTYFEIKPNPNLQLIKKNMSVVIIGYNQYTYINKMVKQLEPHTNDIIIIDNCSTYKPLLDYYDEYKYTLLKMNKNYGHKVYEEDFIVSMLGNIYIITDPDLEFNKKLPKNFIESFVKISNDYKAGRVGFSLLIDTDDIRPGLSYASVPLKQWEGRFWMNKIKHPTLDLYNAPIDTTFCLLNTIHNRFGLSIRVGGDYICKHLPWHNNFYLDLLEDEYDNYLIDNKSTNFWKDDLKETSVSRIQIEYDSDDEDDSWIYEKVKNKKGNSLNISLNESLDWQDNFKLILNVNPNNIFGDNILNYSKKITNIKSDSVTLKQFVYELDTELYSNIKFINLNYNGDEENIIEDLLHYCWINNCPISIKFNIYKWIDDDIKRYYYLFNFFNIWLNNKVINNDEICYDSRVLFIPNKNISTEMFKKNITCVIIGFNQPTYIKQMVKQIELYTNDIVIIDNNSDFKPLLDYYNNEYKYTLLRIKTNLGHKVYEKSFMDKIVGDVFILTDPDLEFNKKLPNNFIESMVNISNYYQAEKVGFALLYDAPDIRTDVKAFGKSIKDWEKQYWTYKFYYQEYEIWSAAIDTTFCLVNKQNKGGHYRIAGDYLCKHLPWHVGFEKQIPKDEFENYLRNNVSTNYWKK